MDEVTYPKPGDNGPAEKPRPVPNLTGGLILILLGVLFLLSETGRLGWSDWWAYFLVGLGAIFIVEALVKAASAADRKGTGGKVIAGAILMVIGGAHLVGFEDWWPLLLIAAGIGVLISGFSRRK